MTVGGTTVSSHYTGEGQIGDQLMAQGNRAIRDHEAEGRELHVFEVTNGVATYLDEFEYVDHYWADGADTNGDPRSLLVYRLRPKHIAAGVNRSKVDRLGREPVKEVPVESSISPSPRSSGPPTVPTKRHGGSRSSSCPSSSSSSAEGTMFVACSFCRPRSQLQSSAISTTRRTTSSSRRKGALHGPPFGWPSANLPTTHAFSPLPPQGSPGTPRTTPGTSLIFPPRKTSRSRGPMGRRSSPPESGWNEVPIRDRARARRARVAHSRPPHSRPLRGG